MPFRTAIVDDEPLARRNLRALLKSHPEFEVVAECRNGKEAVAAINSQALDLVLLDIQMPEMDGFEVLERLDTATMPAIVFVTAFDQFAIRAFDVSATDYLLKPVDDKRFDQAMERVRKALERREAGGMEERLLNLLTRRGEQRGETYAKRLLVKTNSRVFFLVVEELDYIQACDYYSELHVGKQTFLLREPIKALESRLDPTQFARIHRSAIVNIKRIRELRHQPSGAYMLVLQDDKTLKVSRSRWERLQELLKS